MADVHQELLDSLGRFVGGDVTVQESLQRITDLAVRRVAAAQMAGVTMAGGNQRPRTHVYTDDHALAVDVAQYEADRGPCLDAWREQRVVHICDTGEAGAQYPEFAASAQEQGIQSTLSLPLTVGGTALGALNFYATGTNVFDDVAAAIGSDLATVVGVVMATTTRYAEAVELSEQLSHAMSTRAVIEQAKGIIMASTRCSPDRAFAILREQSQAENRKLRDIAEEVVRRHSPPDQPLSER